MIKRLSILVCILFIFGSFSWTVSARCPKKRCTDVRELRENIVRYTLSQESAELIYNRARQYLETMNADGTWNDIDYTEVPQTTWSCAIHFDRIKYFAYALSKEGQSYYKSDEMRQAVEKALLAAETKIFRNEAGKRDHRGGNWWYWNLSIPSNFGLALLCLKDKVDPVILNENIASIEWSLKNPLDYYLKNLYGAGANSTWAVKGNLYYHILVEDEEKIKYIVEEFGRNFEILYRPMEGLSEDAGFRAHYMLDFAGYYPPFLNDALVIIGDYLNGTVFQLPQKHIDAIAESIYDGVLWNYYQGYLDVGVRGRSMEGPFTKEQNSYIINAAKKLAGITNARQVELQEILNKIEKNQPLKVGNKNFWEGDMTVQRAEDFYVSVRNNSSRNNASEAFGSRGDLTTFLGDGCMWIFNDASEFYEGKTFATLNWFRLPGTTFVKDLLPYRYRSYIYGSETFVGGVSNRKNGVSAMQLGKVSVPIAAKKSWFFFDDEVVCLGSDIQSKSPNEVHTVIDQRPILSKSSTVIVDGKNLLQANNSEKTYENIKWINGNNVGYYFPMDNAVTVQKSSQSGKWTDLSIIAPDTNTYKMDFVSYYINHGRSPQNEKYAYVVLANADAKKTKEYAQGNNVSVLRHDEYVHAVKDLSSNSVGAVFWPKDSEFLSIDLSGAQRVSNGILHRSESNHANRTLAVFVNGGSGRVNVFDTVKSQRFAVNEQRIKGNDVEIRVKWFDDANAKTGAYWRVIYDSMKGQAATEYVPYTFTDQWIETVLILRNVRFTDTILAEDGVELAIEHNNAIVDIDNEKYELIYEPTVDTISFSSILYGPIIQEIKISPVGKLPPTEYSEKVDIIEVDKPCIVYYTEAGNEFELTLAEPRQNDEQIQVKIDKILNPIELPEGVTSKNEGLQTIVTFNVTKGRSYVANFKEVE